MIYKVFAIKDSKLNAFLPPFFARSIGEAERMMQRVCNEKDHHFNQFSDDFALFSLGEWDDATAMWNDTGHLRINTLSFYRQVSS